MAGLTLQIEKFILDLLERESSGILEIGRNDLAQHFGCAPSQINYVLATRFTPYKGYYIESRRGGAGFVRITRLERRSPDDLINYVVMHVVKEEMTREEVRMLLRSLWQQRAITETECYLMIHATDDHSLQGIDSFQRNTVRSNILRNMLFVYLRKREQE